MYGVPRGAGSCQGLLFRCKCYNVFSKVSSKIACLLLQGETAMNKKTIGIALLAVGVVLLIGSLAADVLGGASGFGYKQIIGAVAGVIVAVVGFVLYSRK